MPGPTSPELTGAEQRVLALIGELALLEIRANELDALADREGGEQYYFGQADGIRRAVEAIKAKLELS